MSRSKFVSAEKPRDHAETLHATQLRIEKLEKELKELRTTEKHLQAYLLRVGKGQSFQFNGDDGFVKIVKVGNHSRFILDQAKVKKMLKARTPYTTSAWQTVRVDWVRE